MLAKRRNPNRDRRGKKRPPARRDPIGEESFDSQEMIRSDEDLRLPRGPDHSLGNVMDQARINKAGVIGKCHPQLGAPQRAVAVSSVRELGMADSIARRHQVDFAWENSLGEARTVGVVDPSAE